MAIPIDDPAATRGHVVVARIARGVEDGVAVDEQGDAGLEVEGAGEKDIAVARAVQFYRLAAAAVIDCVLDALGVEAVFVGVGQETAGSGQLGRKLRAGGRNMRFENGAPVLREKAGGKCRGKEKPESAAGQETHSLGHWKHPLCSRSGLTIFQKRQSMRAGSSRRFLVIWGIFGVRPKAGGQTTHRPLGFFVRRRAPRSSSSIASLASAIWRSMSRCASLGFLLRMAR